VVAILSFFFWDSLVVYPLKILVVLFHELSHGLAAILSGGAIDHIEISSEQGGLCVTRGGSAFLILNAGYLGSLAWGAGLLVASGRSRHDRLILGILGAILLLVTIIYIRSMFGVLYGLVTSIVFIVVAAKLPNWISDILLKIIGTVSCLYAVWDIGSDVLFRHIPGSDAYRLAEMTYIPSIVWGALWVVLAVIVTLGAFWISMKGGATSVPNPN
jgi:hypothetical protein